LRQEDWPSTIPPLAWFNPSGSKLYMLCFFECINTTEVWLHLPKQFDYNSQSIMWYTLIMLLFLLKKERQVSLVVLCLLGI
jgi:hypothetical protein